MTREEAIMTLRQCQSNSDIELAHVDADGVLTDLLNTLGYQDVVAEWEKIDKWYA